MTKAAFCWPPWTATTLRAQRLIPDCALIDVQSGHDFRGEKPAEFVKILRDFAK